MVMKKLQPNSKKMDAQNLLRRIRYRHLQVLLAVARHGSLTAAAASLDITQPAVSQWLSDIESAVGGRLFVRGQPLKPTALAAPLLAHAVRMLNDAQRVVEEVNAINAGAIGMVRMGAMQVAAASLVPNVLLKFQEEFPAINLSLIEDVAAGLWARFERNELDLLVTRLDARAIESGLPQRRLFVDQHRVVCGLKHPLLSRKKIQWKDISAYPWLMPTLGTSLRNAVEMTFAREGIAFPRILLSSVSPTSNPIFLNSTNALAIMSSAAASTLEKNGVLRTLPLTLTQEIGDVGLVWRETSPGPSLSALINAFESECE